MSQKDWLLLMLAVFIAVAYEVRAKSTPAPSSAPAAGSCNASMGGVNFGSVNQTGFSCAANWQ